jgi:hypothetical protein
MIDTSLLNLNRSGERKLAIEHLQAQSYNL